MDWAKYEDYVEKSIAENKEKIKQGIEYIEKWKDMDQNFDISMMEAPLTELLKLVIKTRESMHQIAVFRLLEEQRKLKAEAELRTDDRVLIEDNA